MSGSNYKISGTFCLKSSFFQNLHSHSRVNFRDTFFYQWLKVGEMVIRNNDVSSKGLSYVDNS